MIKLKVYVPQDGPYGLVPKEGGAPVEEETCYLKSEADKLIAELNIRICEGDEDFEIANNQIKRLLKIVRYQKYKRCLVMSECCDAEIGIADTDGDYEDMQWYQKWYKRWLKIAEKIQGGAVMPIEIKTYKEYLSDEAGESRENVGDHCFVAGCTNPPPYYQVGDERFWCGMCEEHAGMRKKYLDYVRTKLMQCGVRFKINKEAASGDSKRAD